MKNLDENTSSTFRTCSHCHKAKSLNEFSYRSTEQRYESKCKSCRRTIRKCKSGTGYLGHDFGAIQREQQPQKSASTPKRIIEPKVDMTNAQLKAIDFSDLERGSGRKLTDVEKHDAVQRFNEFVTILREGYGELMGEKNVFIRKN